MKYENTVTGEFIERPNRFIAYVMVNGKREAVHVKNTGRCKELLTDGVKIILTKSSNMERKTRYDLIAVYKGKRLINMDSAAPNQVVKEWLEEGGLSESIHNVRPETTYGKSRFDFYFENGTQKCFMEVKGVTLEKDGHVYFPDAPSTRALKHVNELISAVEDGYDTYIMFAVQMSDVRAFSPNRETQTEFAEALLLAQRAGVHILAYDCMVTQDSMSIRKPVEVELLPDLSKTVEPLLKWYYNHARVLPWREDPTPYHVWISEIMLQQTRVEAVKSFYARFIERLPDVHALAEVEEDTLLKLWEGLGYYNRARNLQKAAKMVEDKYRGVIPDRYDLLLTLPGIGHYTAGAIASIAYHEPVAAVDGNVLRVISRVMEMEEDVLQPNVQKKIKEQLELVMPKGKAKDYNQALMELGALVCVPNGMPKCGECPWKTLCLAKRNSRIEELPKKTAKKPRMIEDKTILVIQDAQTAAIHKRPSKGLLAGLYEFPTMEGHKSQDEVIAYLKELGLNPIFIKKIEASKHIFSHKEWHMIGYAIRVDELEPFKRSILEDKTCKSQALEYLFIAPKLTEEKYPIPAAYAAYTKYLNIKLGESRYQK